MKLRQKISSQKKRSFLSSRDVLSVNFKFLVNKEWFTQFVGKWGLYALLEHNS